MGSSKYLSGRVSSLLRLYRIESLELAGIAEIDPPVPDEEVHRSLAFPRDHQVAQPCLDHLRAKLTALVPFSSNKAGRWKTTGPLEANILYNPYCQMRRIFFATMVFSISFVPS